MLKQTISYTDFNDQPQEETLYFNLSKTELADHLYLQERFANLKEKLEGPEHTLSTEDILTLLDLVKTLMKLSYGLRSEDGKRFQKSDDIWTEFTQTAAYDAYLFSLFEDPTRAVSFMLGILPADLREEAEKTVAKLNAASETTPVARAEALVKELPELPGDEVIEVPLYKLENRMPTDAELELMTHDELKVAMVWRKGFE